MKLLAYAKINLTLDIVGKREDGYHLIDSVFQSVGLYDTVEVKKDEKIAVNCDKIEQKQNIAYTVANEFFSETGIDGGARIKIEKKIPLLSGLGGGSADAAAVIIALDRLYKTHLSKDKLLSIALKCGADVPFFLTGGTARVRGIGEETESLPDIKNCFAVLIKAGDKKSTKDMYEKLDRLPPQENKTQDFISCAGNERFNFVSNSFFPLASDERTVEVLKRENPICVSVSGSGPTHFALFAAREDAYKAVQSLKSQGFEPILAPFVRCAVETFD